MAVGNDLTGTIPPELGDLASLTRLHLDVNELTGAIPPELGDLANLEELLLGWNDLTGAIPPELGDLSGLKSLRMQSNELTGAIPPGLGGLARLERLHLNLNRLSGRIPGHLTLLTFLQDVRMDGNGLDGCVARDLSRFTSGINPQADGRDLPACRPNVLVWPVEGLETTERNGKAAVFDVLLEDRPEADVRIALSSSDPGEGAVSPTELVIRPDVWYDSRPVTVRGVDDDARDGDQEYTAVLAPVESGDPAWRGVDPPDVRLTNRDDEPEGIPRIGLFVAEPRTIPAGGEASLLWRVRGATSIRIEPGVGEVTGSEVRVRPEVTTTYTLTAANVDGEATAATTVTVVRAPVISSFRAEPDTIARGDTARLAWRVENAEVVFVDRIEVADSAQLAVAPQTTTSYELVAINYAGAVPQTARALATLTVVANGPPVAQIEIRDCGDGNFTCTYDATGSTDPEDNIESYSWEMGDGTTLAGATVEHGYAEPGRYTVTLTATDRFGAAGAADTVQVANLPPVASFASTCAQLECTFTSTSTDDGGIERWAWDFGDGRTGSGPAATHGYEIGGSYEVTLTATDSLGAGASASRTVTVAPLPVVGAFSATPETIAQGDTARLVWEVDGAETVFIDGNNVTDSTELAVAPDTTTTYALTATNAVGDSVTAEATVTVVPPPAVVSFRAVPETIARGGTARLVWEVEGAEAVFVDGNDVTDDTELAVAPDTTTTYTLTATNAVGDTATAQATVAVVVNRPPEARIAIRDCEDGNYACTYDASGSTDPDGNIASYGWDMGDGTTLAGATVEHGYAAPGRYTVALTVTDSAGARGTADAVQVVNRPPEANFASACTELECTFTSTATDDGGIERWAWDFGDGATGSGATATHAYGTGGSYDVTLSVTDGLGAVDDATRTVTVALRPVIDSFRATPDRITRGDTARLGWAAQNAESVLIDPGVGNVTDTTEASVAPDTTTTYTLTAVNAIGDSATAQVTVTVVPPPVVTSFTADRRLVTSGDTVTLSWRTASAQRVSITPNPGAGQALAGSAKVTPSDTTTYRITATNPAGATATRTLTVATVPPPVINTFRADPAEISPGQRSILRWETEGADSLFINNNVGVVTGEDSATVRPQVTTTYSLTATNAADSSVTSRTSVTVLDNPPDADFTSSCQYMGDPNDGDDRQECTFTSTSTDDLTPLNSLGHAWEGATATGNGTTATATYTGPGDYTVTLTVTDASGNRDSEVSTVTIANRAPGRPTVTAACGPMTGTANAGTAQQRCTFTATARDDWTVSGDLTYSWGGGGTGSSITRTYTSPGRKTASVTATDAQGLTSSSGSGSATVDNDPPGQPTVTATCTATACMFTATAIDDWTRSADLRYAWDGGESGQSITRTYSTPGIKTASVTATDPQGLTSPSGSGSGYIPDPNEAPERPTVTASCDPMTGTANAGNAQQRCTFRATAIDDRTPSANLTYRWNGGEVGRSITRTYTTPGRKTASVTATDPEGLTSPEGSGSVRVENDTPGQPTVDVSCRPMTGTANAGTAQQQCTFTAESDDDWTRSEDLTYSWSGGGTGMSITRTYRTPGEKTESVTATDRQGLTSPSGSRSVTIENTAPRPPTMVTSRCDPMTGTANTGTAQVQCTFRAEGASDDWTPSFRLAYLWDEDETGRFITRTYTAPGPYSATVTVRDEQELTSPSASASVTIPNTAPRRPTVGARCGAMTGNANAGTAQVQCTFWARAIDDWTRSENLTYRWDQGEVGDTITRTYTSPGTKTATVTASDPNSLTSPSASRSVTVQNRTPGHPTVTARCGEITGTANAGNAEVDCTFTARSIDDWTPSDSLTYSWESGESGMTIDRTYRTPGSRRERVTATDEHGQTSSRASGTARVPNEPPNRPVFTVSCLALTCSFTSTSTDDWTSTDSLIHVWSGVNGTGPMAIHEHLDGRLDVDGFADSRVEWRERDRPNGRAHVPDGRDPHGNPEDH